MPSLNQDRHTNNVNTSIRDKQDLFLRRLAKRLSECTE